MLLTFIIFWVEGRKEGWNLRFDSIVVSIHYKAKTMIRENDRIMRIMMGCNFFKT